MRSSLLLEVSGLTVEREVPILRGVDWEVRPGQHWAVLGPNGSGKTSLIQALTGYMTPSSGTLRLLGHTFGRFDWRELRKKVGLVSSGLADRVELTDTVFETVVGGRYATIGYWKRVPPSDRAEALRILKRMGIAGLADRPWAHLSQGERQRVLIGRALMARYRILFLDEPCAGLDPVARERFLQFLERLLSRKNTPAVVLITHHVEEIVPGFTHLLLMGKGRVRVAGEIPRTLTSQTLGEVFGAPVILRKRAGRYGLRIPVGGGRIL